MLRERLDNMFVPERNVALELEAVNAVLERAANTYKNSSNVRKKKFVKKLFSNLYVDTKKGLTIEVNPSLKIILALKWSKPGLARIELATRGFGDHRSTSELQPYI